MLHRKHYTIQTYHEIVAGFEDCFNINIFLMICKYSLFEDNTNLFWNAKTETYVERTTKDHQSGLYEIICDFRTIHGNTLESTI